MCDVWLYGDRACRLSPPAALELRFGSAARVQRAGIANMVFQEWASACTSCDRGEAFLGVRFAAPVVVQCLTISECSAGPTTTATTTAVGSRRSSSGARACEQLVLERSEDNVSWHPVAAWSSPEPEEPLSLDNASFRPPGAPPQLLAWEPSPNASCGSCGRVGIDALQPLELNFSKPVYRSYGSVAVERGLLPRLDLRSWQRDWFQLGGAGLQIRPQEPLASLAACTQVSLEPSAFIDADGRPLLQPPPFVGCVADRAAPSLQQAEPANGTADVILQPRFRLTFDEPVELLPLAQPAVLAERAAAGTARSFSVSLASVSALVVEANASGPLASETAYRLAVPPGVIADAVGNVWPGTLIDFTTGCASGSCPTQGGGQGRSQVHIHTDEDDWAHFRTGMIATLVILFMGSCVAACWLLWRRWKMSKLDGSEQADKPSDDEPAVAPEVVGARSAAWAEPAGHAGPPGIPSRMAWEAVGAGPSPGQGPRPPEVDVEAPADQCPEASASPGRAEDARSEPAASSSRPPQQEAPPLASPGSAVPNAVPEVAEVADSKAVQDGLDVEQVKAQLVVQLCTTQREDVASRKKRYKALCLQWHPDKNPEQRELSEEIFKFLQEQRSNYLRE